RRLRSVLVTGAVHAVSGGGGGFLRAFARCPPPPNQRMLHPPARTGSGSGAHCRAPPPHWSGGPARGLRVFRAGRGPQLLGPSRRRLARIVRRPAPQPPRTRGAPRADGPRLADTSRGRGN